MIKPIIKHCITCGNDGHTYLECKQVNFFDLLSHAIGIQPITGKTREEMIQDIERVKETGKGAFHDNHNREGV